MPSLNNRYIDLMPLNNNQVSSLNISGEYELSSDFVSPDIIKVNKILVEGNIIRKENNELNLDYYLDCKIKTTIIIEDSISLDEVEYEINTNFSDFLEEIWKNDENMLDIFMFLWENILLEVPLRFTKVTDLSKFHGDGWKLISEEERNQSLNPFNELRKEMEREG